MITGKGRGGNGARRHTEAGMTMIELLVTIVIMGVAFSVIVGGLGISIVGSDTNRRQATAETVLRNFADHVKFRGGCTADPCPVGEQVYVSDCDAAKTAYQDAFAPVAGFTRTVVSVSPGNLQSTQFLNCPAADTGLQLIVLSVSSDGRPITETAQVVKRQP